MTKTYFDKPDIALADDALIAIACGRNELLRLPFWLEYYRSHGVDAFFFVDNGSSDGTAEYLKSQDDVFYFYTETSYVESKSGRLWTTELARHYGIGKWVLTIDADEQLVFPCSDVVTIKDLTRYLDSEGTEGVYCMFLDMYGPGQLRETVYTSGTPFIDTCPYFDAEGYVLRRSKSFPYLQISGGPRQRIFWEQGERGLGPVMRKIPLVRWKKNTNYLYSTHSLNRIRLSEVTGCLLHFKFFSTFSELAAQEALRGDRTQMAHYQMYADRLEGEKDILFYNETSRKLNSPADLLDVGYMTASHEFIDFAGDLVRQHGGESAAAELRAAYRDQPSRPTGPMTANLISRVWSTGFQFRSFKGSATPGVRNSDARDVLKASLMASSEQFNANVDAEPRKSKITKGMPGGPICLVPAEWRAAGEAEGGNSRVAIALDEARGELLLYAFGSGSRTLLNGQTALKLKRVFDGNADAPRYRLTIDAKSIRDGWKANGTRHLRWRVRFADRTNALRYVRVTRVEKGVFAVTGKTPVITPKALYNLANTHLLETNKTWADRAAYARQREIDPAQAKGALPAQSHRAMRMNAGLFLRDNPMIWRYGDWICGWAFDEADPGTVLNVVLTGKSGPIMGTTANAPLSVLSTHRPDAKRAARYGVAALGRVLGLKTGDQNGFCFFLDTHVLAAARDAPLRLSLLQSDEPIGEGSLVWQAGEGTGPCLQFVPDAASGL